LETVQEALTRVLAVGEARLRAIVGALPDGEWAETGYLDYEDQGERWLYTIRLTLTKRGERLAFDFAGSSAQAPAVINASITALRARIVSTLRPFFSFVIGFSPAPLERLVEITAPAGTVVNCTWPAGMSKGTTAAVHVVEQMVARATSRMLSTHEAYKHRALMFRGITPSTDVSGLDQFGRPYSGVLPNISQAWGSGARYGADGIDSGGRTEPDNAMPNVETTELRYPVLFLYRGEAPDTAGPGTYRGGVAAETAFLPHDVASIPSLVFHMHGVLCPSALGVFGGYPGFNEVTVLRDSNLADVLAAGVVPTSADDLRARVQGTLEIPPLFGRSHLGPNDVYVAVGAGGGGYGDPLAREPARVAADVRDGRGSAARAARAYGVVVRDGEVDAAATAREREALRERRRALARPPAAVSPPAADGDGADVVGRIDDRLQVVEVGGERQVRCTCGALLGPPGQWRDYLAAAEVTCVERLPYAMRFEADPPLQLRELYCPRCFTLHDVEVVPTATTAVQFVGPPGA
jgi:N-methylhydantoinase B